MKFGRRESVESEGPRRNEEQSNRDFGDRGKTGVELRQSGRVITERSGKII